MPGPSHLGEFLAARRAQLRPEDVGLSTYGERRRVPGLRREELALVAGVSPSYYARLEQGQSRHASAEVLEALATALRLGDAERDHLRRLATPPARRVSRRRSFQQVHPATRELLAAIPAVPAWVQGPRTEILAWNRLAHGLIAGHVPFGAVDDPRARPTTAELIFDDPHGRELYDDWDRKARAVVGNLRAAAGHDPDDEVLAALVGHLTITDADFAAMWSDHRIRVCDAAAYVLHHPVIGTLSVTQQSFTVAAAPGQSLLTMIAADTASADALRLLDRPGTSALRSVRRTCL
ncbi:helix-turn-helix domain-containing protein [Pseudonocardia phyllosphaerae]|uniref:helix-turn-helix domain-containing protein n=1 Tax=Pseudonocardia phyllosphaerae TaxID=3390502 RepID=UPI00397938B8